MTTKMSKQQFKTLMKECLTELINEGAFDRKLSQIAESKMSNVANGSPVFNKSILYGNQNQPAPQPSPQVHPSINPKLLEAVRNVTSATPSGRKTMFEEIMLDTAMTTLQNQIANGDAYGSAAGLYNDSPISQEVKAHDEAQLNALAGGDASRWAAAAFGNKNGNKKR